MTILVVVIVTEPQNAMHHLIHLLVAQLINVQHSVQSLHPVKVVAVNRPVNGVP